MSPFVGTDNKSTIRIAWDRPIIQAFSGALGRKLSYLGLSGPLIQDVREWRSDLLQCTSVERLRHSTNHRVEDANNQHLLMVNAYAYGLSGSFSMLRGQIEDVLIQGRDVDHRTPPLATVDADGTIRFQYDLVNLDFEGGIGYQSLGVARRIRALESVFGRLEGSSFLLLLTLNVRDTINCELIQYLAASRSELNHPSQILLDWYASTGKGMKAQRLKAAVPLFIRQQASAKRFDCFSFPAVMYVGNGNNQMVHFVFQLARRGQSLPVIHRQPLGKLLQQPLLVVDNNTIAPARDQNPGCSREVREGELSVLCSEAGSYLFETSETERVTELSENLSLP